MAKAIPAGNVTPLAESSGVPVITRQQLLALGLNAVAYVRNVEVDGGTAVAIFAANGQRLAVVRDHDTAIAAAWENGLSPVTIH
jgi:hypothetical protein